MRFYSPPWNPIVALACIFAILTAFFIVVLCSRITAIESRVAELSARIELIELPTKFPPPRP